MLQEIHQFWFKDIDEDQWRRYDPAFDELLKDRFLTVMQQAAAGELSAWRDTAKGRLAEIIILV